MTQRDQGLQQLTIDGGAVSHPPPPPSRRCPECRQIVKLNADGSLRRHSHGYGSQRTPCWAGGKAVR